MAQKVNKEILNRWQERKAMIMANNFAPQEDLCTQSARIERVRKDYAYFVKTYFPHLATCECGKFQIDAAEYILKTYRARAVFE